MQGGFTRSIARTINHDPLWREAAGDYRRAISLTVPGQPYHFAGILSVLLRRRNRILAPGDRDLKQAPPFTHYAPVLQQIANAHIRGGDFRF